MKKSAIWLLIGMAVAGCSKSPGSGENGYHGIPWGSDGKIVAEGLKLTARPTATGTLFAGYYRDSAPRMDELLRDGFAKLLAGRDKPGQAPIPLPANSSLLSDGSAGYSLLIGGKFAMNLQTIPADDYQSEHDRLMKWIGVIDKKVEYRASPHETSYMIQWHNGDGIVILARESDTTDPSHPLTAAQVIHMDKHTFDTLSARLVAGGS